MPAGAETPCSRPPALLTLSLQRVHTGQAKSHQATAEQTSYISSSLTAQCPASLWQELTLTLSDPGLVGGAATVS